MKVETVIYNLNTEKKVEASKCQRYIIKINNTAAAVIFLAALLLIVAVVVRDSTRSLNEIEEAGNNASCNKKPQDVFINHAVQLMLIF